MNRAEMISQFLSLAPQEAKACPECQDPRVSQVSQDLQDSQDSPDPQDNMASQELLAERDPWGCQAPPALEVRLQHPRNVWGPHSHGLFLGSHQAVFQRTPRTARCPKNRSFLLSKKKKIKQLERTAQPASVVSVEGLRVVSLEKQTISL